MSPGDPQVSDEGYFSINIIIIRPWKELLTHFPLKYIDLYFYVDGIYSISNIFL